MKSGSWCFKQNSLVVMSDTPPLFNAAVTILLEAAGLVGDVNM